MNIRNVKQIKAFARERLKQAPAAKQIVLIYEGLLLGMALVVLAAQYLLEQQIGKTGGLGSMQLRSTLTAIQTTLPILQSGISMCLGLGYMAAMMRVARGQYVSRNTLKLGFDRFWSLLRLTLVEMLIYTGAGVVSLYAAATIFVLTPLSREAMEILTPLMEQASVLDPTILLEGAVYNELVGAMTPALYLFLGLLLLTVVPIMLRYRLSRYVLVDKPGLSAIGALRESRRLMKGNVFRLLRLDLGFWWYYLGIVLVSLVSYGDQLLLLAGISIPGPAELGYYGFLIGGYLLSGLLGIWLRNRVESGYALAYDALKPKEEPQNAVVLGNIFQM